MTYRNNERRMIKFKESLKFAHKVLITDDGHLVTTCRALIPEYDFIAKLPKDKKMKFSKSLLEHKHEFDNGLSVKVTHFNLKEDFHNTSKASKQSNLLINILYIVDSVRWFNRQAREGPKKNEDKFFRSL